MVRAGKLKSGAAKKVNRWRSSSSSNPDIKRHRQNALARKGTLKNVDHGAPGLTADSLRVLDRMTGATPREEELPLEMLDMTSEASGGTFRTMMSGVSDCTNMTFNRIKQHWNKNPEKHREVVAVLAAITEVIREKGFSDESETAYFAVLSTTLTQVSSEESLAAVSYLFSLNLRQVAPGVIHKNFAELIQMILGLLAKNFTSTALLKSLVSCLGTILKRGTTVESWTMQDTKSALSALLAFVLHPKPKVRKAAQKGCALIVHTAGMSIIAVEEVASFTASELKKATKDQQTLQLLTFLRAVIFMFPAARQKEICQTCLRLQTLGTQMVRIQTMRTLNDYLRGCVRQSQKIALAEIRKEQPEGEEIDVEELSDAIRNVQLAGLPVELVGKLLSALREVIPAAGDRFVCTAWLEVVHSCCFTLSSSDQPKNVLSHLPKIIQSVLSLMSDPDNAPECASTIQKCLLIALRHLDELDIRETGIGGQIITELMVGTTYQYSGVMDSCLDCISAFYNSLPLELVLSEKSVDMLTRPLDTLCPLRLNPLFSHKIALDSCVGSILSIIGPGPFLTKLPIKITGDPSQDGQVIELNWIIPIFETKMNRNISTGVFFRRLANMADAMFTEAAKLDQFQSAVYFSLYREIWALFPKFCQNVTDQPTDFLKPAYAKGLNSILESSADHHGEIKQYILSGLRKLCMFSSQPENGEYKTVMKKFSPNYVKTLLNMYRANDMSANVMSCAKEFVPLLDEPKAIEFYNVAKEKATDDPDESLRPMYWDIVVLLAPWIPVDMIKVLFAEAHEMTKNNGATIQKKGWRILEQIGSTENDSCRAVMSENMESIMTGLMSSLGTCAASARKPRLQLLELMLPSMKSEDLKTLIPELVLCTKDKNAISRTLGYNVLASICNTFAEQDPEADSILEFIQVLLQGLNGTPLTVACTLNVLTRMLYEFRTAIPTAVHGMILENVLVLMSSLAREILKATVSFLITLTKTLARDDLAPHVERIITAVVNWKPETRNPFRLKVRRLLERLVKKFGFELVQKFVPEKSPIAKMLANAKKTRARTERQLAERSANNDEAESDDDVDTGPPETLTDLIDDSDDDDTDDKLPKTKTKRKFQTQIMEDDETVTDFLSPTAAQSLTRNLKRKSKVDKSKMDVDDDEIGTAPDGRIFVREKAKKVDQDMLSSDDEEGMPENIRMSDQKVALNSYRDTESSGKKKKTDGGKAASIYKAKNAGGDVKRHGKQDPYSYLPLRKDVLNKRNRKKGSVPGLANIVRSAKKGVQKGKRNRKSKLL